MVFPSHASIRTYESIEFIILFLIFHILRITVAHKYVVLVPRVRFELPSPFLIERFR